MELLLNLAWMLLALPAYLLWRNSGDLRRGRRFTSAQCLLTLACVLVVLFPVVSATDDLHAMRAEMEESPAGKRSVRQASSDRPSSPKRQNQPSFVVLCASLLVSYDFQYLVPDAGLRAPDAPPILRSGRSPPLA